MFKMIFQLNGKQFATLESKQQLMDYQAENAARSLVKYQHKTFDEDYIDKVIVVSGRVVNIIASGYDKHRGREYPVEGGARVTRIDKMKDKVSEVAIQREIEVKRNKQVDVPTEAWQKRIERDINEIRTTILNEVTRTEKTEETLIILVAYLSSVGLLDMNDWNKYLQISRK